MSLGTGVHLIDTAGGPRMSLLKTNVHRSLEGVLYIHVCVFIMSVAASMCVAYHLQLQEECCMEVEDYI